MAENIAVVGCACWGKNLVRSFAQLGALGVICDVDSQQLQQIKSLYPQADAEPDYSCLLSDKAIKGVIAAPALRDGLRQCLSSQAIATAIYYPLCLHLQEVYRSLGYQPGDFPENERPQGEVLSLPIYPELSEEQIERIVAIVKDFCRMQGEVR